MDPLLGLNGLVTYSYSVLPPEISSAALQNSSLNNLFFDSQNINTVMFQSWLGYKYAPLIFLKSTTYKIRALNHYQGKGAAIQSRKLDYLVHLSILYSSYDDQSIFASVKMLVFCKTWVIKMYLDKS